MRSGPALAVIVCGVGAFGLAGLSACGSSSPPGDASSDSGAGDATVDALHPQDASPDSARPDGGADAAHPHDAAGDAEAGLVLAWSDEFDESDGGAPDPGKWSYDTGGGGWGNQEREYYTNELANAFLSQGNLVIRARTDNVAGKSCWYGACQYTSARILSKGHFAQAYGRFETRAKLPSGQGMWPAFWMLGNDIDQVNWPACGEIDVMENIGREPATNHGSLHGPVAQGSSTPTNVSAAVALDAGTLADGFHVYAVEWAPNVVRFYFDGALYETRTPADNPPGAPWVYDHPYFVLLNLAVGGSWPGDPDNTTVFPADLVVDYVRVYAP